MRAAYLDGHDSADCVKVGELARPQRKDGEVLVRIKARRMNVTVSTIDDRPQLYVCLHPSPMRCIRL